MIGLPFRAVSGEILVIDTPVVIASNNTSACEFVKPLFALLVMLASFLYFSAFLLA